MGLSADRFRVNPPAMSYSARFVGFFFRVCHCLAFGLPSSFVGRYTEQDPVHNQVLPLPYAFC